jgi:hypothetical protein
MSLWGMGGGLHTRDEAKDSSEGEGEYGEQRETRQERHMHAPWVLLAEQISGRLLQQSCTCHGWGRYSHSVEVVHGGFTGESKEQSKVSCTHAYV